MTIYMVNPPRKGKRRAKRKVPQGFSSWREYMAHIRPNNGGRKVATKKRATARRKTTRKRAATTTRRKTTRRRTYKRNPPKVVRRLSDGLKGALVVTVGKAGARIVADLIPLPGSMMVGGVDVMRLVKQAGTAIAVGLVADQVTNARNAELVTIGALQAPVEEVIKRLNVPYVSAALSSYPRPMAMLPVATPGLSSYPRPGLKGYVQPPRRRAMSGAGMYDAGYRA